MKIGQFNKEDDDNSFLESTEGLPEKPKPPSIPDTKIRSPKKKELAKKHYEDEMVECNKKTEARNIVKRKINTYKRK